MEIWDYFKRYPFNFNIFPKKLYADLSSRRFGQFFIMCGCFLPDVMLFLWIFSRYFAYSCFFLSEAQEFLLKYFPRDFSSFRMSKVTQCRSFHIFPLFLSYSFKLWAIRKTFKIIFIKKPGFRLFTSAWDQYCIFIQFQASLRIRNLRKSGTATLCIKS